jgi:hypothetical protein
MVDSPEGAAERLELILALNKFSDRIDHLSKGSNSSTSHIQFSAGSFGVLISAFCAVVSFLMFCVILVLFINHDRKIDDLGDYLNAIYVQAPSLKPPEKE